MTKDHYIFSDIAAEVKLITEQTTLSRYEIANPFGLKNKGDCFIYKLYDDNDSKITKVDIENLDSEGKLMIILYSRNSYWISYFEDPM